MLPLSAVLLVTLACAQDKEPVTPVTKAQTTSDKVYTYQQVEQVPIYETGTQKLFGDIIDPIMHSPKYYSKSSIAARPQGRVIVRFQVSESGIMEKVALDKSGTTLSGPAASVKEVQEKTLAAVQNLPGKWLPGRQAGQAIPVSMTVVCDVNSRGKKDPDQYILETSWSLDGMNTKAVMGISMAIKEPTKDDINKYAIRPDPSYYKNHKRQ